MSGRLSIGWLLIVLVVVTQLIGLFADLLLLMVWHTDVAAASLAVVGRTVVIASMWRVVITARPGINLRGLLAGALIYCLAMVA